MNKQPAMTQADFMSEQITMSRVLISWIIVPWWRNK